MVLYHFCVLNLSPEVSDMDVPAAAMEFQDHSGKISPQRKLGRGNNEIKRIENMKNCQVTFCKRQNGLLKKAYEFFVLGDAEVAKLDSPKLRIDLLKPAEG
ncbi:hypothetical protein RJ640_007475 [Escallonia rubra]|uniref:MADS-box domain-containing protein n=1 Tax=Escallonia rubra TaxID=112253 RepID=A0AA88RBW2_9ASTE|nr:hypothetical protein RJ640_007475 [Escallonia rubra]